MFRTGGWDLMVKLAMLAAPGLALSIYVYFAID
jgi:hypothetical protein